MCQTQHLITCTNHEVFPRSFQLLWHSALPSFIQTILPLFSVGDTRMVLGSLHSAVFGHLAGTLLLSAFRVTAFGSGVRSPIFLSFDVLIGWQLSIWICCKPFFSLLCNCQLLCFWRLVLSTVVEVFPRPFFSKYCSFKDDVYYLNQIPSPRREGQHVLPKRRNKHVTGHGVNTNRTNEMRIF